VDNFEQHKEKVNKRMELNNFVFKNNFKKAKMTFEDLKNSKVKICFTPDAFTLST